MEKEKKKALNSQIAKKQEEYLQKIKQKRKEAEEQVKKKE